MANLFKVEVKFPGKTKSVEMFIKTNKKTISYDMVDRSIKNLVKSKCGLERNINDYGIVAEIHTLVDKKRFDIEIGINNYREQFNVGGIYTITKICPTKIYFDKEL